MWPAQSPPNRCLVPPPVYVRHDLVWLCEDGAWQALRDDAEPLLRRWFQAGRPAIVARRGDGETAGMLRLGVPLPPAQGRQRLALRAEVGAVIGHAPAPALTAVIAPAPAVTRAPLRALARDARTRGLQPRVFGSFAWQALTGLDYVRAQSDLDLLWSIDTPDQADAVVDMLRNWEAQYPRRADGELRHGPWAVNWREYASDTAMLLLKSDDGCALGSRRQWWAQSPPESART